MIFVKANDYDDLSRKAADLLYDQILFKPDSVLGLATGSTPVGAYQYLVQRYRRGELDFSQTRSVNLDEYCGLPEDDPNSYHTFMRQNLFDLVNFCPKNCWLPNGMAADKGAECKNYDRLIRSFGGIDLQVLGIGQNGHIGFNEPADCFTMGTHEVFLDQQTIRDNARFFSSPQMVPISALTTGIRSILQAKKILLLAGEEKTEILKKALFGPVTPRVPASILQLHPHLVVITTGTVTGNVRGN